MRRTFTSVALVLGGVALTPFTRLARQLDDQLGCELLGDDD